jgi:aryl-alcohol dehydrogenase-like predicted oxidoreductase
MTPSNLRRRDFLAATSAAAAVVALPGAAPARRRLHNPVPESATARVKLGETGVEMSLLGMGTGSTGTNQSSNQTKLGVKEFTRLVRHAYESGIRFFDVADQYGSHTYLREALKGIPRDTYTIQTKTHASDVATARSHLERYRMELGVEYIDILLLHCMTTADWPQKKAGAMEYLMQAREQGLIRCHGTSCHGMDPLRTSATHPFVQVDLARINPEGELMDDKKPDEVASELEEMHEAGKGVIGMKIFGEGKFKEPERRDASLRYVFGLGTVDAITVGLESVDQVDDLVARTNSALKFLREKNG